MASDQQGSNPYAQFDAPKSFKDPGYDAIETEVAQKVGIPQSLMSSIRTKGERSNADAVSNKGARTVYQIIPKTRDALLKKYGVDAYSGDPHDAAMASAHLLKESLTRHGGNEALAAAEYHGGVDPSKWGKKTHKYVEKVSGQKLGVSAPVAAVVNPYTQFDETAPTQRKTELGTPTAPGERQTGMKQPEAWTPYVADRFRKGFIQGTVGGITQMAANLPKAIIGMGQQIREATPEKFRMPEAPLAQLGQRGSKFLAEQGARAVEGMEKIAGVKNLAIPRDSSGAPSKSAEYLGQLAYFTGASALPSSRAIALSKNKALAATLEAAATALSSEGSITLREAFENHADALGMSKKEAGSLGETVGAMFGPNLLMTGVKKSVETGRLAGNKFNIPGLRTMSKEEAAKAATSAEAKLGMEYHPPAAANVQEAEALRQRVSGFTPNIARATGAPAHVATYENMLHSSPEYLAKGAEEEGRLRQAITGFREQQFPAGKVSVPEAAKSTFTKQAENIQNQLNQVENKIRQVGTPSQAADRVKAGQAMKPLIREQFKLQMQKSSANYKAFEDTANREGFRPSTGDVYSSATRVAGDDAKAWDFKSPAIAEILRKYAPQKETGLLVGETGKPLISRTVIPNISAKEWHSLYKRLGREIGHAEAMNTPESRALLETLRPIQHTMYETVASKMPAATKQAFQDANAFHQKFVIQDFRKGIIGQVTAQGKYGERTLPSQMVEKIWANPEGVEQYFNAVGGNPRAKVTYENGVRDLFFEKTLKNGQIDPGKAREWLNNTDNKHKLSLTPELRKEFENRAQVTETALARRDAIVKEQKVQDQGVLSQFLKSENPEQFIAKSLTDPVALRGLVNSVRGNKEATQSLARSIATHISTQPNVEKFLAANEQSLKPIMDSLGKNHWQNLKDIGAMERITGRVTTPTTVSIPSQEGIFKETLGVPAESIFSRFFGRIRPGETWRNVYLGGKFMFRLNSKQIAAAKEATYFNPDVSKVLAQIAKEGPKEHLVYDIKNHLFAHGIRVYSTRGDNREPNEE